MSSDNQKKLDTKIQITMIVVILAIILLVGMVYFKLTGTLL